MTASVLTFGEALGLAMNNEPGRLATSRDATLSFGGAESNVAIALCRLGVNTTWVSRLGSDPFGALIHRELRAEGVTTHVAFDLDHPTGVMLKERRTTTAANVFYWRAGSAASLLSASDIHDDLIRASALLHVSGITPALSSETRRMTMNVVERACAFGVPVSFDINHRERLWSATNASPTYRDIIALSSIVFASDHEAAIVVGDAEPAEQARRLASMGAGESIIKLGSQGCVSLIDGELYTISAVPITVVDTVGAGDAFVGAYLAERITGVGPAERLRTAVTAGAIACTTRGDWESSPTRADLEQFRNSEGIVR